VDEYTDKNSGKLPDCYLRSKKEGLPDLAIEVKTLQRDLDRPVDFEMPNIPEYSLSVRNFHVVLRLNLIPWKEVSPKKVLRLWGNLGKELSKYKEEWEKESDRLWLEKRMKDFLLNYFSENLQKQESLNKPLIRVRSESEGDNLTFTITPVIGWSSEYPAFHIEEIERYVEESKGKFEHLRKVKSDKSDGSSHLELLLVKGLLVADTDFNSLIEKIKAELTKKGYDCLLCIRKRKEGEDDEFITIEIKNGKVRISGGSWDGNYYLIIPMDNGMGDGWKTQILGILKEVLKVV